MVKKQNPEKHRRIQKLFEAVFTISALDPTIDPKLLERILDRAKISAARRAASLRRKKKVSIDLDVLGHIVYRWQRAQKYLDNEGRPLPIRARGPAPSVEALFREIGQEHYFKMGLRHLVSLRRLIRTNSGKYVPATEVTILPTLSPEVVELLSLTINRLFDTVFYNTSPKAKQVRLLERVALIPDLPPKEVPAFKLFVREQGSALVSIVNDWLESRRGTKKSRARRTNGNLTAGVHAFAFVERN